MLNTRDSKSFDYTKWLTKPTGRCFQCSTILRPGWSHNCEATRLSEIRDIRVKQEKMGKILKDVKTHLKIMHHEFHGSDNSMDTKINDLSSRLD